jgi:hypothetical protein
MRELKIEYQVQRSSKDVKKTYHQLIIYTENDRQEKKEFTRVFLNENQRELLEIFGYEPVDYTIL